MPRWWKYGPVSNWSRYVAPPVQCLPRLSSAVTFFPSVMLHSSHSSIQIGNFQQKLPVTEWHHMLYGRFYTKQCYTPCFKKTTPYLIAHNFGKCSPIFNFFHPQTQQRYRLINWLLNVHHTLKASIPYLVKCKCQETIDNLKQMSRLTINFNLIYYS